MSVQNPDRVCTKQDLADFYTAILPYLGEPSGSGGGGASSVSDLTDVELDNVQNGQVLKWNSTDEVWENANESGGGGGTSDYTDLTNKPSIESVTLSGNKTAADLGLAKASDIPTKSSLGLDNVVNTGDSDTPTSGGTTKFTTGGAYTLKQDVDKAYKTSDSAETTLADSDKFPFYDASASAKRNSTWSNIKSKLKTYFDTLYNNYTLPTATSSVLGGVKIGDNMTIEDGVINPSYLVVANKFNKADLYSTTEKVVGCWTDGRPIYQKTFTGTIPNATTVGTGVSSTISVGASVQDYIKLDFRFIASSKNQMDLSIYSDAQIGVSQSGDVNFNGIRLYGSPNSATNNKNCIVVINSNTSSNGLSYTVTARYTKTTDSANSFKYADENDYSTSEKIVGTWIDGKPIYQRTYTGTLPATIDDGTEVTLGTISDISLLLDAKGYCKYSTGEVVVPQTNGRVSNNNTVYSIVVFRNNTSVVMYLAGTYASDTFAGQAYAVTIQYTKTT